MDFVTGLLVGHPVTFFTMSALFATAQFVKRRSRTTTVSPALLVAAALWALAGIWEFAILRFSPDANIRVDLLVIFPVLALASLWALVRGWR